MERQAAGLKQCITIFTILLWNWITPPSASAHPVVQYWRNRSTHSTGLVFTPEFRFYTASDHFNNDSKKTALPNDVSVNRQYLDLNVEFPAGEAWTFFGRISLLRSQIKNSPTGDASVFGLSDQLLGAAYRLVDSPGGFRWTAQAEVTLPAYTNGAQKQNGEPYLGDQSIDFNVGSFIDLPLSASGDWVFEAGAAYRQRTRAFSSAIPYSLLFQYDPRTAGMLWGAGVRGQLSLDTDGSDASAALAATSDQGVGGGYSDLIYAINPAWMVAQLSAGYRNTAGTTYSGLLGYGISGKNAPAGLQISLAARFDFGNSRPSVGNVAEKPRVNSTTTVATTVHSSKPKPSRKNHQSDESLSYTLNGEVTSANDSLYLCKIDLGTSDGIHRGQIFDIFRFITDSETGLRKEERVARAQVTSVKNSEAALSVIEYFVDQWVEVGFIARRLVE